MAQKYLNIKELRSFSPKDQYYFLDANVWIFALGDSGSLKSHEKKYSDIFFDILDDDQSPAKVIVCSLLISEVINTFMHVVALNRYRIDKHRGKLPEPFDFKRNYRDLSGNCIA